MRRKRLLTVADFVTKNEVLIVDFHRQGYTSTKAEASMRVN